MKKGLYMPLIIFIMVFTGNIALSFTVDNCEYSGLVEGVKAEYYTEAATPPVFNIANRFASVNDYSIYFDWGSGGPEEGNVIDLFSVRWRFFFNVPQNSTFTFYGYTDDGVRGYLNGVLATFSDGADCWRLKGASECSYTSGSLTGGTSYYYHMEIQYYENTGSATARVGWSSSYYTKTYPIPQTYTFMSGLRGEYYSSSLPGDFTIPKGVAFENTINNWADYSTGLPPYVSSDYFAVRWSGYIYSDYTSNFTSVCIQFNEGARLWVDGNLIVDQWTASDTTRESSGNFGTALSRGFHSFRFDYYDVAGGQVARLGYGAQCNGNTGDFTPIPERFFAMIGKHCGGGGAGGGIGCSMMGNSSGVIPLLIVILFFPLLYYLVLRGLFLSH